MFVFFCYTNFDHRIRTDSVGALSRAARYFYREGVFKSAGGSGVWRAVWGFNGQCIFWRAAVDSVPSGFTPGKYAGDRGRSPLHGLRETHGPAGLIGDWCRIGRAARDSGPYARAPQIRTDSVGAHGISTLFLLWQKKTSAQQMCAPS